jgi:hypothetical protein
MFKSSMTSTLLRSKDSCLTLFDPSSSSSGGVITMGTDDGCVPNGGPQAPSSGGVGGVGGGGTGGGSCGPLQPS